MQLGIDYMGVTTSEANLWDKGPLYHGPLLQDTPMPRLV